ncbi:MAG: hypothetical protein KFH87_04265 [Bacteroidetes bacterium]|nr:hypothetical protein [Bacteroidota bacterium]
MNNRKETALLLLVTAGILTCFLFPVFDGSIDPGFPLDDGWIHATYARNLAGQGEFAFNPGEASTGTTSLLWTVTYATTLSVTTAMLPSVEASAHGAGHAVWSALALSSLSLLLLVHFWKQLLLLAGFSRLQALLGSIALLLSGILVWWTLSGMETVPFLLFATLALLACVRERWVLCGFSLALLILTRPEGLLLAPILAGVAWKQSTRTHGVIVLSLGMLGLATYIIWNLAVGGGLWTSTFAGRQWLAVGGREFSHGITEFLTSWVQLHLRWFRLLFVGMLRWAPTETRIAAVFALILLLRHAGNAFLKWRKRRTDSTSVQKRQTADTVAAAGTWIIPGVLIIWALLHGAAYALLLPYPGHAGRYLAPLLLTAAFLFTKLALQPLFPQRNIQGKPESTPGHPADSSAASAVMHAAGDTPVRIPPLLSRRVLPASMLLAAMLLVGSASLGSWRVAWISSVEHINLVHRRAAEWLAAHTPPQSTVAAFDIGAIGFFAERHVVDLGGLLDSEVLPYMRGRIDEYILSSEAGYVAMILPYEGMDAAGFLPATLGYGRRNPPEIRLSTFCFPQPRYNRHITITGNAYPCIVLDQVASQP